MAAMNVSSYCTIQGWVQLNWNCSTAASSMSATSHDHSMRWQKAMWDAVTKCDADLLRDILRLSKVQVELSQEEQVYFDEEAPLHLAAYCGHNDLIRLMLEGGMDIDSYNVYSDNNGYMVTPLHWAVYKNKVGTVKFLLSQGADPFLPGKWGILQGTPLEFAKQKRLDEIVQILEDEEEYEDIDDDDVQSSEQEGELKQEPPEGTEQDKVEDAAEPDAKADDISSLESVIRAAQSKRRDLQAQLEAVNAEIGSLSLQLEQAMGTTETKAQKAGSGRGDITMTCPVCLSLPRHKVFSCVECDNILCNACRSRVNHCPCCRQNFSTKSPKRNRWAEKLAYLLSQRQ